MGRGRIKDVHCAVTATPRYQPASRFGRFRFQTGPRCVLLAARGNADGPYRVFRPEVAPEADGR